MPDDKAAADLDQQNRTIAQLVRDGWVVESSASAASDGQVMLSLTTPQGVSHIIVMRDGEKVVTQQQLGKDVTKPNLGEPR